MGCLVTFGRYRRTSLLNPVKFAKVPTESAMYSKWGLHNSLPSHMRSTYPFLIFICMIMVTAQWHYIEKRKLFHYHYCYDRTSTLKPKAKEMVRDKKGTLAPAEMASEADHRSSTLLEMPSSTPICSRRTSTAGGSTLCLHFTYKIVKPVQERKKCNNS